jgi:hypothetical protein
MDKMTQAGQASNQYDEVEEQLTESFRPVIPDPEFVRRLYHRLTYKPAMVVERRSDAEFLLVIALGVLTGSIVILLIKQLVDAVLKRA